MGARLTAAALLGLMIATGARAEVLPEEAVKAAYIPKFIPFISWPDSVFTMPDAPVTICVVGTDPFGGKLEQAASEIRSGEHPIAVRYLEGLDASVSCQLVFLAKKNEAAAEEALDALKGKPVVTVTDSGLKTHGVISFLIEANHVRFDIDDAAAAQGGLVISSKLLGLAHAVKQRSQP